MTEALPFAFQGLVVVVDEFYCHRQRRLGLWERIGHPLDTQFLIFCLAWLLYKEPGSIEALAVYTVLAALNCLFVTKDEWEHGRRGCSGFENWLHALLYLLHPVVLIWAGYLWWSGAEVFHRTVATFGALCSIFLVYQILYWNVFRYDQQ